VVQQNAATAEEAASASEEISAQAEQVRAVVRDLVAMINGGNGQGDAAAMSLPLCPHFPLKSALGFTIITSGRP
jgi:methyl-accepting chemotaxis protein